MVLSKKKQEELENLKKRAINLYKEGYSFRDVGFKVGKSYEWVRVVVKNGEKGFKKPIFRRKIKKND